MAPLERLDRLGQAQVQQSKPKIVSAVGKDVTAVHIEGEDDGLGRKPPKPHQGPRRSSANNAGSSGKRGGSTSMSCDTFGDARRTKKPKLW